MAVKIGTAANHIELWNTLLDFLQNDPALVAQGQNWEVAWRHATNPDSELVLRGPGLSGTDQVLVGMSRADGALSPGESTISFAGMTGVIPSAERYSDHVNATARRPLMFVDQNPMRYWLVANGRRFALVVRISTIYEAAYCGLFLPYANPEVYPLPLFIGGSRGWTAISANSTVSSWRALEHSSHRHFVYPQSETGGTTWADSPAQMLDPSGRWRGGTMHFRAGVYAQDSFVLGNRGFPAYLGGEVPYATLEPGPSFPLSATNSLGYASVRSRIAPGLNGELPLTPITLMAYRDAAAPEPVTYGVLDGVYSVPGLGNAAENIITLDGVDHLVVQNVQRTTVDEYWALALE